MTRPEGMLESILSSLARLSDSIRLQNDSTGRLAEMVEELMERVDKLEGKEDE